MAKKFLTRCDCGNGVDNGVVYNTVSGSFTSEAAFTYDPTTNLLTVGNGQFGDGAVDAPSISNTGDSNTGWYFPAADQMAASTNGVQRLLISTTAITSTVPYVAPVGAVGAPGYTFAGLLTQGFYSIDANTIGVAPAGSLRFSFGTFGNRSYTDLQVDGAADLKGKVYLNSDTAITTTGVTQTLPAATANINLTTTTGADLAKLPNAGLGNGQLLTLTHIVDGGALTVSLLNAADGLGFSTITFTNVGETATLRWNNVALAWTILAVRGAVVA